MCMTKTSVTGEKSGFPFHFLARGGMVPPLRGGHKGGGFGLTGGGFGLTGGGNGA